MSISLVEWHGAVNRVSGSMALRFNKATADDLLGWIIDNSSDGVFERLKAEVCQRHHLDPENPRDDAQATMISLLLCEQDRQVAAAIAGERNDPKDVVSINEQLQAAYHPKTGDNLEAHRHGDDAITAELNEVINGRLMQREYDTDQAMLREEKAAIAAARAFTDAGWPAGGRDGSVDRALGGPATFPRPALPAHVTYIDADCCDLDPNNTAALLKACEKLEAEDQHEAELLPPEPKPAPSTYEPWRPYVSENGISTNIGSLGPLKRSWGPSRDW